jgi:hypothetical protein
MSDEKKPLAPPVEGRTQAFRLKIDGWMTDLMKQDFDLEESPPAAPPVDEPLELEGVPPKDDAPKTG